MRWEFLFHPRKKSIFINYRGKIKITRSKVISSFIIKNHIQDTEDRIPSIMASAPGGNDKHIRSTPCDPLLLGTKIVTGSHIGLLPKFRKFAMGSQRSWY